MADPSAVFYPRGKMKRSSRPITNDNVLTTIRDHVEGITTPDLEELFLRRPDEKLRDRLSRSLSKLIMNNQVSKDGERWFAVRARPAPPPAGSPPAATTKRRSARRGGLAPRP